MKVATAAAVVVAAPAGTVKVAKPPAGAATVTVALGAPVTRAGATDEALAYEAKELAEDAIDATDEAAEEAAELRLELCEETAVTLLAFMARIVVPH